MTFTGPNIGLFGNVYSGKTHIANVLVEKFGYTRVSFAAGVKETAAVMVQAGLSHLGRADVAFDVDRLNAEKTVFRPLAQFVGEEFGRQWLGDAEIWIKQLLAKTESGGPYVVDDMRYHNEALALVRRGWKVTQVDASRRIRLHRSGLSEDELDKVLAHPSEQGVRSIKVVLDPPVIVNNNLTEEQIVHILDGLVHGV